jgi:hydroxymethylglutaryl-CoA lyase
MGIDTGVRIDGLLEASRWLADTLGHPLPGQLVRSGLFPDVLR